MAGGTDVERHAAAAACDGKGIRVDRQYRESGIRQDWSSGQRIAHHNLALRAGLPVAWRGRGNADSGASRHSSIMHACRGRGLRRVARRAFWRLDRHVRVDVWQGDA